MKVVLFLASVLVGLIGLGSYALAANVVQQAVGAAIFVAACVLFGSAAIVDAIEQAARKIAGERREPMKVPTLSDVL